MLDARILAFRVGHEENEYISPEDVVSVSFRVESEEGFHLEERQVRIILNIRIDATLAPNSDDENEKTEIKEIQDVGVCQIGFLFFLENFHDLFKRAEDEKSLVLDGIAMAHLLAMAYSTARGMILVKTRGTSLEGSLLPIIDPHALMEKGMKQAEQASA